MASLSFGRLVRVDLREIWSGQADDFLAWLAQEDHLELLGKVLAFDLKLETHQNSSQTHRAHLVCRDTQTNNWVIFESPTGSADHAHLGQILAHAKGYSPVNIVWMAGELQEDHRSVLEWLNQITDQSVNFFGLEIEFWRIADSPLAPKFNLVSFPQGWQPTRTSRAAVKPAANQARPAQQQREQAVVSKPESPPVRPPTMPGERREAPQGRPPAGPPAHLLGREQDRQESQSEPAGQPGLPPLEPMAGRPMQTTAPEWQRDGGRRAVTSGLLRRFQERDTTVSPSGMLQQVDPGEASREASGLLARAGTGDMSITQQVYLEFWTRFWEDVVQWENELPPQKPMLQGWVTFPMGREDFYLIAFLSAEHKLGGMGLVLDGLQAKDHFHRLVQDRAEIEREFGTELDWRELPEKTESHVYTHRSNVDPHDRTRWGAYMEWFAEQLETFAVVFGSRVRELGQEPFRPGDSIFRED